MDLTAVFSDDQIAVIGCLIALATCGLVAALSFQFGAAGKQSQQLADRSLPFPSQSTEVKPAEPRKAA